MADSREGPKGDQKKDADKVRDIEKKTRDTQNVRDMEKALEKDRKGPEGKNGLKSDVDSHIVGPESIYPYNLASRPKKIGDKSILKESIPFGDYEIKDLPPLNKEKPKKSVKGLRPQDKLDSKHDWQFPPERIRRSDRVLSPEEQARRKEVFNAEGTVGFRFDESLPAGGHVKSIVDSWTAKQKEGIRNGSIKVVLTAFASAEGPSDYNMKLTESRGGQTRDRFVLGHGFPSSSFEVRPMGDLLAGPGNKDNPADRVVMIDLIENCEPDDTIKTTEKDAESIAAKFVKNFPEQESHMWRDFREGIFNPLGIFGIAKFAITGFKNWMRAVADGNHNLEVSRNFIPAYLGELERLTTRRKHHRPLIAGSTDAVLGAMMADIDFGNLSEKDQKKLVNLMQDSDKREVFIRNVKHGLRKSLIRK